ncbi:MAG: acyltransferase family protein [Lachnospiraceae bacterium]|nr:acyltransferase family protein [Lachnospiraceae bacterium]
MEQSQTRKHYIDNLRNITILLLFPVHTFMVWNDFGSRFYIWMGENRLLSTLIVLVNPWFMPILFVLAGISARFALKKRTVSEFIRQRVRKLMIPFVCGLLFLVPFQALYARKYFDGYSGGLFDHWKYFFTHLTDFTGYDGAFTPGHLWFILFLFVISMITLIFFRLMPYERLAVKVERIPTIGIFLFFLPVWLMYYLGNFGGFSIGKNLMLYLIGYYVLSNDLVMERLEKNIRLLLGLCLIGTIALIVLYYRFTYYGDLWINYIGWNSILCLLVLGKKFLNRHTKFTEYFNQASYPVYILHQSILVAVAYYMVQMSKNTIAQVLGIAIGSFLLTMLAYHLIKLIPGIRKLIGCRGRN